MTEPLRQCNYCGYFHAPDYSDVRETVQDWIETICRNAKANARKEAARLAGGSESLNRAAETGTITQPDPRPQPPAVAVTARTPDGREHKWLTQEDGEHVRLPLVLHVKFKRIHGYAGQPRQAYKWDAGFDLEVCEPAVLEPGQWQNLHTGIVPAIPEGYWGHILARSSTWRHRGIRVEPAVIDASYRGELMIYAVNTRKEPQEVKVGERLAQIIIVPLPNVEWVEQMNLPAGERGERGYGSSGGQG